MGKKSREKRLRRKQEKEKNNQNQAINHSSQLEKICFFIVQGGVLLALFTPLIFIRGYFFPFVVPKTIFFRIVVSIVFIAYILLAFSNRRYRPRITPLTIAISLFLGILFLTSITGVNFGRSFWSVFERMEGLLTFFHVFAFYIILTSCFKEKKYWYRILTVSISVCLLISFIVLFSADPITRGGGTLGNSSFFSAYLLFNIFFALVLLVLRKGGWRIFYGLSLIVFLAALFFNPLGFTKGAVSSFAIGMALLAIGFMFFSRMKILKIAAPIVLILLILIGVLVVQSFYFQERAFDLRAIPDRSRQIVWNMAWQGWQERPWLGWGLENFNIPFVKYYDPELPITGDVWYDRVHNIVLDIGISSGIIGLLSYLSIFGVAIFGLAKTLLKIKERKNLIVPLAMIILLLVYFLQNLWVFDMISTYIMFFLSLAFIGFLVFPQEERKEKVVPLPSFVVGFLIILSIFSLVFGNIQPGRTSRFILKGINSPLEQSILTFQKAFRSSPMARFEGVEHFSARMISLAAQENQDTRLLRQGFELAEEEFKKAIAQNPLDFRLQLFLGRHYNAFYQITGNREKLTLADQTLQEALRLGSNNQQVYFILSETRFLEGREEEAIELLEKALELEPRYLDSRLRLIRAYRLTENYELALSELKKLEDLDFEWQEDSKTLKEGVEILKEKGEGADVLIPLYEKGAEFYPQNLYFWENLINLYVDTGQSEKLKKALELFVEINPELRDEVKEFLEQLED